MSSIYRVYTGAIGWISELQRSPLDSLTLSYATEDDEHDFIRGPTAIVPIHVSFYPTKDL